jgi:hypothetical protein
MILDDSVDPVFNIVWLVFRAHRCKVRAEDARRTRASLLYADNPDYWNQQREYSKLDALSWFTRL